MSTHTKFHPLLDQLIELNQQHRHDVQPASERITYAPCQYAKLFCTVVCDIGRQAGKTEYIKRRADKGSLVIVSTVEQGLAFFGKKTPFQVLSVGQLEQGAARGRAFTTIYVDEPAYLIRRLGWDKFYKLLTDENTEQTFVLLGDLSWC